MAEEKDPVELLVIDLQRIAREERAKSKFFFSNKEAESAGKVYEEHDFGTVKAYLLSRGRQSDMILLKMVERIEREPKSNIQPVVRAFILRHLVQILAYKEGGSK